MAEADGLFAIEVDADDYADAAADDTPTVSRTYQSEVDFQAQRASYTAKQDGGGNYEELLKAVPVLRSSTTTASINNGVSRATLSKKDVQLLNYAVGEMYYDRKYTEVISLCERVLDACQLDDKTRESISRWSARCKDRLEHARSRS